LCDADEAREPNHTLCDLLEECCMPELPEVQLVADSLAAQIVGHQIIAVSHLDWERMVETHTGFEFATLLAGRRVRAVGRRAKWLLVVLDGGWTLALHLRMSGHLTVVGPEERPGLYTHLALTLDDGRQVFFHDTRKFGRARLLDAAGLQALEAAHGLEPLSSELTPERLADIMRTRRRQLKPLLLDQRMLAGIGNIYADEALWRAELHPLRSSDTLSDAEIARLHAGIRSALADGLANGGSTLRDYRNAYGELGSNQQFFNAYGRENQPCPRCGTPIVRTLVGQRGTHFCPTCQV
jgi:formamidopyrimidine-DNA glycosylase